MRFALLAAATICLAAPARAQTPDSTSARAEPAPLRDDRWLIEFELPRFSYDDGTAGAVLGVWNMVSERSALGADFRVRVDTRTSTESNDSTSIERKSTSVGFSFGPGLRHYFETRGDVSAYVDVMAPLSVSGTTIGSYSKQWSAGVGVRANIGISWFITDALSLAGGVGAGVQFSHSESEYDFDDAVRTEELVSFSVSSGELRLGLWF